MSYLATSKSTYVAVEEVKISYCKDEQEKTVTPTEDMQEVVPDSIAKTLAKVIVEPIPGDYIKPEGEIVLTEQGTFDVAEYKQAVVTAPFDSKFAQLINGTITEINAEDLQGITKIRTNAFSAQTYLRKVELPNTITKIGGSAFYDCTSLREINFPDTITNIGGSAFYNTTSLAIDVVLPDCALGGSLFCNSAIKSITCCGYKQPTTPSNVLNGAIYFEKIELREGTLIIGDFIGFVSGYNKVWGTKGKFIVPTTVTEIKRMYAGSIVFQHYAGILKGTTPPILGNADFFKCTKYFVPLEGIPNYESADNWQTYRGKYYPLVNTFADLSAIDTTLYTRAMTIENDYQEYKYSNSEWVEVN